MRGRSLILDEALEFIDAAKEHIFFAGQYYPNDITGRHLKAAYRRGVRVEIAYNHFTKYHRAGQLLHLGVVLAERLQSPSSFFEHAFRHSSGYLHAKLIATEQGAIIGSHNFISAGVRLGTAELALRVLDPEFARRATETVMKQLPEVRMHGL